MSIVFVVLLIIQIGILSFYIPNLFHRFVHAEINRYPEAEYPLLYTLGTETRLTRQRLCTRFNWLMGTACVIVLLVGLFVKFTPLAWSNALIACMILQFLPYGLAEIWHKQVQQFRSQLPPPTIRRAVLTKRTLGGLVNPTLFYGLLALGLTINIITMILISDGTIKLTKGLAIMIVVTGFTLIAVYKTLSFVNKPRQDPIAANKDELAKAKIQSSGALAAGYIVNFSAVFALLKALNWISREQDEMFVAIALSIAIQLILYLVAKRRLTQLDTVDYSVYRHKPEVCL